MGRAFGILLGVLIVLVVGGAALFGIMVLAGLSATAGDRYGPWARALGFAGIILIGPAFKLGVWVARGKRRRQPEP